MSHVLCCILLSLQLSVCLISLMSLWLLLLDVDLLLTCSSLLCVFFFSLLFPVCLITSSLDFIVLLYDFQPHLLATAGLWVCNIWNECRCWSCTGETKWYNRRGTENRGAFLFLSLLTFCSPSSFTPLLLPLNLYFSFSACLTFPAILPPFPLSPPSISSLPPACCTLNAACRTLIRKCVWPEERQNYLAVLWVYCGVS